MTVVAITDQEFAQFQRFIYETAGITLGGTKKALVSGRLARRLESRQVSSYGAYFRLLASGSAPDEVQAAVDLLTTNETYFFREPKHFELLREILSNQRAPREKFRVWSAASSSGEEAYSIAMVLAECLGGNAWEVLGSDISMRVLERARLGHYALARASNIPQHYLERYCLKGNGPEEGSLLIQSALRRRVEFLVVNLNEPLPAKLGSFDVIFLRNVMIYFSQDTKRQVVARILSLLKPGGYFLIGHSETLNGVSDAVETLAPSIYRKA